ncbi:MAG: RIP metalloprotease RseP [Methylotenera sp.]
MLTALAFIFTLGLIVTVHEYGHFQVAKWCGVKILRFSIGFGKPLWSRKFGRDQTEFVIAAIPLGGYVKMLDEREIAQESNSQDSDQQASQLNYSETELKCAFNRQSVAKRIAIVLAGPFANLLLAIFLYWLVFMMGVVGMKPIIGKVVENSPAAIASINLGETIQKINGKDVATWQDARWLLLNESLKNKSVEIQALDSHQQIHLHQLDLSGLNHDDFEKDILEKLGLTIYQPDIPARIGEVLKSSPADLAGLKANDLVLVINKNKVRIWNDFVQEIRQHPNVPLDVLVKRDSEEVKLTVRPEPVIVNGNTIGRIGATFVVQNELGQLFVTTHYSTIEALVKATEKTWDTAIFSLKMLGNMVTGQASWKSMSGPVTIASYAGQSASMGFTVFITFLALISISIGVLNLLPIPVLDGGYFMYYMVEIFTGKPVSEATMVIGQKIGFSLLGFMMILALYNDINRLITG